MDKKVIITGVTGFIGFALCKEFIKKGYIVYGIGNSSEKIRMLEDKNFYGFSIPFEKYNNIPRQIKEREFDYCFHLAHIGVSGKEKSDYQKQLMNTRIACDLVQIASKMKCRRFVFVGSVDEFEAFKKPDSSYITPTHSKIYAITKLASEQIGKCIAENNNIEYVSALLSLTYGPGNNKNVLPNVIIKNSIQKNPIFLLDENTQIDMIYISDAVNALIKIAKKGKNFESYYVGHRKILTIKEIMKQISTVLCDDTLIEYGKYCDKNNTINYNQIDLDKLYKETGFECKVDFMNGFKKTKKWIMYNDKK